MEYFPAALEKLVEQFARLPGIGSKSAQRLAFFVLSLPEEEAKAFADAIVDAKRTVTCCPVCRNFSRAYIRHLQKADELLGMRLAVMHNLYFYNHLMERIREALDNGTFQQFHDTYVHKLDTRI